MSLWLIFPLFALAQASCYDYEYYDPDTGASLPGNACAGQAAKAAAGTSASVGQPSTTLGVSTSLDASASLGAPVAQFASAPATQFTSAPYANAPAFASGPATFAAPAQFASAPVYASAPAQFATSTPIYGSAVAAPVASLGATVYSAPQATFAAAPSAVVTSQVGYAAAPQVVAVNTQQTQVAAARAAAAANPQETSELEYYKRLGEQQAQQHKRNKREVQQASTELSHASLLNDVVDPNGGAFVGYSAYRLGAQKQAANAYKSESRIADKNANDAYQRYQQDPSRLNLLVSKYQDLNADLQDSAYHYNVINSGTFGQELPVASSILGLGFTGNLFNTITQVVTNRQQSSDLTDIQRQMKRVARQIQTEAKSAQAQAQGGASVSVQAQAQIPQGSVQQRMMAMSVYGPQG